MIKRVTDDGTEEHVLAVPTQSLRKADLLTDGFRWLEAEALDRVHELVVQDGEFLPRSSAERDPEWKQIIPYAVVHFEARIFLLRRSRRGGEPRLYGRLSIGVGGHINPESGSERTLVLQGLRRELDEELILPPEGLEVRGVGTLNDDSNEIGKVHFGMVYLGRSRNLDLRVREEELLSGEFVELEDLARREGDMETWSRWVLRGLEKRPGVLHGESPGSATRPGAPLPDSRQAR